MMLAIIVVLAVVAGAFANIHDRAYYEEKFFNWMQTHQITPPSGEHFIKMLQNFANNDDLIETHNGKNLSYSLGHNQFSHMSIDEWRAYVKLGLQRPSPDMKPLRVHAAPADTTGLATEVDWVSKGAVASVKDQGQCGSCWAFSATGAIEGAVAIKYGTVVDFSEQHFVDCDNFKNGGKDMGCNGGLMDHAFSWAQKNGGICSLKDYPYVSGTTKTSGTCADSSCTKDSRTAPKGYVDVQVNSDAAMMSALNLQPVAVAIEADEATFQLYKSGVLTASCGTTLDHGVLAVGYGTDSATGLDYYKVKNSWGTSWGESGYIRLQRGVSQKEGQCGILAGPPSYPTL